jgi:hypothetical protein
MTYKEIVDLLGNIADTHKLIADWGYGDLSDIKTRSDNTTGGADYPYMFINPGGGARDQYTQTWTFNLIMMEVVGLGDDFLKTQSDCAEYLDDVLARLQLFYVSPQDPQPVFTVSYQPFKERFQDEVAGMTAVLQLVIKKPLNDCITPFYNPVELIEENASLPIPNEPLVSEGGANIIEE